MSKAQFIERLGRLPRWLPLVVAAAARLAMLPFASITSPNLWEYGSIARNIIAGRGYSNGWIDPLTNITWVFPSAFMPPGMVAVQLAGLGLFGDNLAGYVTIFLLQVAFGVIFVAASGRIAKLLSGREDFSRLTMWLAAIFPTFVFATSSFGILASVLMLNALFLLSAIELSFAIRMQKPILWRSLAVGALGGVLGFFRSESPMAVGITLVVIAWLNRDKLSLAARAVGIAIPMMLLVLAPWIYRNYEVMHRLIPSSSTGPFNFWRGHNARATGGSTDKDGYSIWMTDEDYRAFLHGNPPDSQVELRFADYHAARAEEWISQHPTIEAERTLKKFALLWFVDWYYPASRNGFYIILHLGAVAMFVLGLLGVRRSSKNEGRLSAQRESVTLILLWCAAYTAVTMAFFSLPRFQILLQGLFFPIASYGIWRLLVPVENARRTATDETARVQLKPKRIAQAPVTQRT